MLTPALKGSSLMLAAGDVLALVCFGVIGLISHEKSFGIETVVRSIVPFAAAWLTIAPFLGAFSESAVSGRKRLIAIAAVWVPVGIVALCLRALVFDRELFNAFFVIALVGNGMFLVSWRAVYSHRQERAATTA